MPAYRLVVMYACVCSFYCVGLTGPPFKLGSSLAFLGHGDVTYLILKAALSGVLVMIVSEVARRSPGMGGLIASLPLISVLAIVWLWRDTADVERIAVHAKFTFWYVLPAAHVSGAPRHAPT